MSSQLVLVGTGFAQTWLATRVLGPSQFGGWALILSVSTLVSLFLSFRTSEALTSFWVEAAEGPGRRGVVLSCAVYAEVATKALSVLVLVCAGPILLRATGADGSLLFAVICAALARFFGLIDPIWFSLLRHERRINDLAVQPIAIAALQLVLNLLAVALGFRGVASFAGSLFLAQAASAGWKLLAVRGVAGRPLFGRDAILLSPRQLRDAWPETQAFWRMMSSGYLSSCLSSLVKEADGLLIGLLGGARDVGFYRLAKSLAGLLQTAAQSVSSLLFQQFAELHAARDPAGLTRFVGRIAPPLAITALVGGTTLALIIQPLIAWLFGTKYLPALIPFRILLVGVAISSALVWVSPLLTMLRRMRDVVVLNLLTFVIFVAVLAVSIPAFGALAPAIALSAAWALGHLAGAFRAGQVLGHPRGSA
jgi:O-antigen/teichoic acid export membrane protein